MNYPDLSYQCVHCGYGCQHFEVDVGALEARRLRDLLATEVTANKPFSGRRLLVKQPDGSCTFHDAGPQGGCRLHRDHGMAAKPGACQDFPFRPVSTAAGDFVGVSFACTAVLQGHGPKVGPASVGATPRALPVRPLAPGLPFELKTYLQWEELTLGLLRSEGEEGLTKAAIEISESLNGTSPSTGRRQEAEAILFRCLMGLAEGPWTGEGAEQRLDTLLQAHLDEGVYHSQILGGPIDVASIRRRWQAPSSSWPALQPFFEHLLFRKYLLEGPDVHSRLCSLPTLARLLQFLALAHAQGQPETEDLHWALRQLEYRLTFHARGLDGFLGHFSDAYLDCFQLF